MVLNRILKIMLIVVICMVLFFGGITIYANFFDDDGTDAPKLPDQGKARYYVYIPANGNMLFTDEYHHSADNIYILRGYWELIESKYKYRDIDLILDEDIFGQIEIGSRVE